MKDLAQQHAEAFHRDCVATLDAIVAVCGHIVDAVNRTRPFRLTEDELSDLQSAQGVLVGAHRNIAEVTTDVVTFAGMEE